MLHLSGPPIPVLERLLVAVSLLVAPQALLAGGPLERWESRLDLFTPIDVEAVIGGYGAVAVDDLGNVYVTGTGEPSHLAVSSILTAKFDAGGSLLWQRSYKGAGREGERGESLAIDGDGNLWVAGHSNGLATGQDLVVLKYDGDGNELWSALHEGPGLTHVRGRGLAVDSAGNGYVVGVSFASGQANDIVTLKFDGGGNELWSQVWDNPVDHLGDEPLDLAVDGSGNVVVAGRSQGASSGWDLVLLKYSSSGSLLWSARYDAESLDDLARAVVVDGFGNIFVAGSSRSVATSIDVVTMKYSPSGSLQWIRRWDDSTGAETAADLGLDANSNLLVAGTQYDGITSESDGLVLKYDSSGNLLWARQYDAGLNGHESFFRVACDVAGSVYLGGQFFPTGFGYSDALAVAYDAAGTEQWAHRRDFDGYSEPAVAVARHPSGGVVFGLDSWEEPSRGGRNMRLLRYDAGGTELWTAKEQPFAGSDDLPAERFARLVAADGSVTVAGTARSDSSQDIVVSRLDATGSLLWTRSWDGPAGGDDVAHAVVVGPAGEVIVVGESEGSTTGADYVTLKYDAIGNLLWSRTYDEPTAHGDDRAAAVAVNARGRIAVTGASSSPSTSRDIATVVYGPTGTELWMARYDEPTAHDSDEGVDVEIDSAGAVVVLGISVGSGTYSDFVTIGYDSSGGESWVTRWDDPTLHSADEPVDLVLDGAGNVYVTGESVGPVSFSDYVTIKYDSAGRQQWLARYDRVSVSNLDGDRPAGLLLDGLGNVYVTGSSYDDLTGYDIATVKYDRDGNELWVARWDGPGAGAGDWDLARGLALDGGGRLVVTGNFRRSDAPKPHADLAVLRYDTSGTLVWSWTFPDPGWLGDEAGSAVGFTSGGDIVVVGGSQAVGTGNDWIAVALGEDLVAPTAPTLLQSLTHPEGGWSPQSAIAMTWSGASDEPGGSGLLGYSVVFDALPGTVPDGTVEVVHGSDPQAAGSGLLADGSWYFHLRACDAVGNCSPALHRGPYGIDTVPPSSPGALASTSHSPSVPSSDPSVDFAWTAAYDSGSGLAGYAWSWSAAAVPMCDQIVDLPPASVGMSAAVPTDGTWSFHLCATDAAGNWTAASVASPFIIDTVPPRLDELGSVRATGDGRIDAGEIVPSSITQLVLRFGEALADPPGDVVAGDVSNPGSYRLFSAGPNRMLESSGCGAAAGDDVRLPIDAVLWDPSSHEAALVVGSGGSLGAGRYRLVSCPTVADLAGNPLDGDGDGSGGDPFTRDFAVELTNLLWNPNFDRAPDVGWVLAEPVVGDLVAGLADADRARTSGSVELEVAGSAGQSWSLTQCVAAQAERNHLVWAQRRVTASSATEPTAKAVVEFFPEGACSGAPIATWTTVPQGGDTAGTWMPFGGTHIASPLGTLSARVTVRLEAGGLGAFRLELDQASLEVDPLIFGNGFESGDASLWSSSAW